MFKEKDDSTLSAEKAAKEKIAKAEKSKAKQKKPKKGNVFLRMWKAIRKFFKDFRGENKKIIWPDAKTVAKSTGVVLAMVAVIGLAIYLVDLGLSTGVSELANLAGKMNQEPTTTSPATTAAASFIQPLGKFFLG